MTLDDRLTKAVADTHDRIEGLAPGLIRKRTKWIGAAKALAVAVLGVAAVAIVVTIGSSNKDDSIAAAGSAVQATLQPTAAPGENRAASLVSINGRATADLEVRSLVVDDTGTLWLSLAEPASGARPQAAQLFSFDGRQWRSLETPHRGYWGVLAGSEDALWVDTFEGMARFDGESWKHFTSEDGVPRTRISSAAIGPGGELWLYSIGLPVGRSLEEPPQWAEHSRVTVFDGTRWSHWEALEEESIELGFLDLASDGTPWIASARVRWGDGQPGGVWKLDGDTWVQVWEGSKPLDFFSSLVVGRSGEIWAAYREFVLHLTADGGELLDAAARMGTSSGQGALIDWQPTAIATGVANDVWVATMGGGVLRFDGNEWLTFDESTGLPGTEVADLAVASDGRLWLLIGREEQRVVVYDPES